MEHVQYEATLLDIYNLCETYTTYEGLHTETFLQYLEQTNTKMDLLDFYYNILIEFIKKTKDDIKDCELKQTYMSGSIIPPPEQNLVVTQTFLKDIKYYSTLLQSNKPIEMDSKIELSYNLELSSLIAFNYQLKWAVQIIQTIRANNHFFAFLMADLNKED